MIDIEELRRLAQEATHPLTKGRWMRLFGERTVYDRMEDGCRGIPVVSTLFSPPHPFEAACLDFIAAANPATLIELLDRLEDAKSDALEQARLNGMGASREAALMAKLEVAEKERDNLRAKIEVMEKQEPVKIQHRVPFVNSNGELVGYSVWIDGRGLDHWPHRSLYALPGAKGEEK
jgi:hypothetical protein